MIADPSGHRRLFPNLAAPGSRPGNILVRLVMVAALVTGCGGQPARDTAPEAPEVVEQPDPDAPVINAPAVVVDAEAVSRCEQLGLEAGVIAARVCRDRSAADGVSAETLLLIDARIAWLAGEADGAETLLEQLLDQHTDARLFALADLETYHALAGDSLAAARYNVAGQQPGLPPSRDTADRLFNHLQGLPDAALQSELSRADDPVWRGWLTLALAARRDTGAVSDWRERHPEHPAAGVLPAGLDRWIASTDVTRVALLLPLGGRLADAANAVLEGAARSLYVTYPDPAKRPDLVTVDTEAFPDPEAAYREAARLGSDIVIGPLTKNRAAALGNLPTRDLPVIALNRPEALPGAPENWSALSLSPEDEARNLAELAFGQGLRRAVLVLPDDDWGRRMDASLSQRWRELGGETAARALLGVADVSSSEAVGAAVGALASEARIKAVEAAFDAPVEARARRREDFDVVFLLTPSASLAREIRPLLVFHYSGDAPVYAPSAVHVGGRSAGNRDLNGVHFVDIPAMFAQTPDRYTRLRALGADAVAMLPHRAQAEDTRAIVLRGATGLLRRRENGEIERRLISATFAGDEVQLDRLP